MTKKENIWTGKSWALRALYTIFLAVLITLFFGLGVDAFYPQPKAPTYPALMEKQEPGVNESLQVREERLRYEKEQKDYMKVIATYNRNVSVITLGLALAALVISLLFVSRILLISDALLLGGLFTLIYSIGRGFASDDLRFRFVIVSIGLLITVALGYLKFIKTRVENE